MAALTRVEQAVNFGSYQVAQSSVTAFFAGTGGDFDPTAHRDEWIKIPTPSTSLRAGSAAKNAARMGTRPSLNQRLDLLGDPSLDSHEAEFVPVHRADYKTHVSPRLRPRCKNRCARKASAAVKAIRLVPQNLNHVGAGALTRPAALCAAHGRARLARPDEGVRAYVSIFTSSSRAAFRFS